MSESGQVGQLLAQTREAQDLSLQQVANELKLSVSFVKAIEAEQCSSLPDVAFVRGYVRNYARLLGLSKEQTQQVVAHFESIMAPAKEIAPGAPVVAPKTQGPRWWRLLWLIAVVAIIGQTYYMWQNSAAPSGEKEAPLPKAETLAPEKEIQQEIGPTPEASLEEEPLSESADMTEEAPAIIEATPDPQDIAVVQSDADEADSLIEEKNEPQAALVLTFADECWLSVTDSTGRALFSGTKQGGEELALEGQAPYRFVFGNGAALESMQIAGEEQALPERRAGQVWRYSSN